MSNSENTPDREGKQGEPLPSVGGASRLKAPVEAWSYTLRAEHGGWLAQVVLTSDGMFSAVSDWGNFSYAWRAAGEDFREFMSRIGVDYFGGKMVNGMAYVVNNRKVEAACHRFAEKVLPVLQATLKAEAAAKAEGR